MKLLHYISPLLFMLSTVLTNAGDEVCAEKVDVDWAQRAKETLWTWPHQEPSLFQSTMRVSGPYKIILEHEKNEQFIVKVMRDERLLLRLKAHSASVFEICGSKLVYAEFTPSVTGCTVIAFDLEKQKQLWAVDLEGIGPISHSAYHNRVFLGIVYRVVNVYGWESAGKYLEYLDLESGKVLGHRLFEKGFK